MKKLRKTHIIRNNKLYTVCGQSNNVMTDSFESLVKWVEGWMEERTEKYLKTMGYCGHCIKKFIKYCYVINTQK